MEENKVLKSDFGIDFVISENLPNEEKKRASNGSYDITCPFCNGKRKFNVNPIKNVARCNKCGGSSGYNSITLHAALNNLTTKDAYKDLLKRWNGLSGIKKQDYISRNTNCYEKQIVPAPISIRNIVYYSLLSSLDLSESHKSDLLKRGLSDDEITRLGYKTIPACGLHSLAVKSIYDTGAFVCLNENKEWGIPGYTDINDINKVSIRPRKNGFLIPIRTISGEISGMQIRYDNLKEDASKDEVEAYKKYSWYSSSEKETGCSVTGCENIHFAGDWSTIPTAVSLTEGVLKADLAAFFSDKPFLGLVGVNNIGQLERTLCSLIDKGLKEVNLFIDMDYGEKKEVKNALENIKTCINSAGSHNYILDSNSLNKVSISYDNSEFVVSVFSFLPSSILLFLDKDIINKENYTVKENEIVISNDYLSKIRNKKHKITIVDISTGFENYHKLDTSSRRELLLKSKVLDFSFIKTGLKYHDINWDPKYKGIDDYLKYRKSLFQNE